MGHHEAVSSHVHTYRLACSWEGSTGSGYEAYSRAHRITCPPAEATLDLSSDPAFLGSPARLNPEQLLVAAASSCQLLSFLAVAARARLDVVAYEDSAEGMMPEGDRVMWVTEIRLRPVITVRAAGGAAGGAAGRAAGRPLAEDRIRHLCEVAHRECFIANSLRTQITVEPTVRIMPEEP